MQLEGKRIIVTGSSKGIGAAVVRAYAAEGAIVESVARTADLGAEVARGATASGPGTARFTPCDVTDRQRVTEVFNAAADRMGGLDVLAHVAGVHVGAPAEDVTDEMFDAMYRGNVLGTIITNQVAFRLMSPNGGAIINFGSEAGISGVRHSRVNAAYGPSKAAIHSWTRHVSREWGPRGIRVNAVLPYVWTPMYDDFRAAMSPEELAQHEADTMKQVPLGGKFGNTDRDLTPVLVFLASDASHFITGQMIPVDGGLIGVR
jgi:3-oxoacyl-[acyl-carrier protein] reductase